MIAASPVPSIVAGLVMRARRRIASHFFVHHATSAEDAVAYAPQNHIEQRQFEKMQGRGVVREAGAGRYWLDTAAWQAESDARRRRLIPIILLLVLIGAAIPLFFYKG
ncbi:hypothetical protein FHS95_002671 [Sphingomonas naasensis]|uniref:Uncharacterized protein n=1 Tax=Sphingomonas naasensis TaxID=1344951 RepID=A0A4S1WKU8_9SPHN|nr:hypothetical protein [Sphingomonas naasensis]NIJ20979.1 hypothetical protein [Sphingomonas naasensis]TGX43363.1 hypothetical protein E5A74_09380 [Sphingomonas naasensis]